MDRIKLIKRKVKQAQYDNFNYLGEWKQYKVYNPYFYYNVTGIIGYPEFLLDDGKFLKWSTHEESFEIIDYFFKEDENDNELLKNKLNIIATRDIHESIGEVVSDIGLNSNVQILIYSLPLSASDIIQHLISHIAKIEIDNKKKSFTQSDWTKLTDAMSKLKDSSILINDSYKNFEEIESSTKEYLKNNKNDKKTLVIINNFSLLRMKKKCNNLDAINDYLDDLAKSLNISILALVNLIA